MKMQSLTSSSMWSVRSTGRERQSMDHNWWRRGRSGRRRFMSFGSNISVTGGVLTCVKTTVSRKPPPGQAPAK